MHCVWCAGNVYGSSCLSILAQVLPPKGYAERYYDNTCVLANAGDPYLNVAGGILGGKCLDGTPGTKTVFEDGLMVSGNRVYVPNGTASVKCGGVSKTFEEFQAMGYDKSTKVTGQMPSAAEIVGWAKALLSR